ncbi:MAG: UDP-N-acetylmuramoyl-L-alanyl-D-glutamate--2,6-diaminopimelate ligase [Halioglobus sp.]
MAAMQSDAPAVALSFLLQDSRHAFDNVMITGIQLDSRKVSDGDLFLALPGDAHDGRQFIEQAVANGAAAVVAEAPVAGFVDQIPVPLIELMELGQEAGCIASRFYANPSSDMHVVGVTGTNGKTTTTALIAQLGRRLNHAVGVIGTLGSSLDGSVSAAVNTTPDPVSMQGQLSQWRDQGVFAVAMEVSSHALVQGRVSGTQFETAVFTNLSRDHLDYHGTMEAYGRAKKQLFTLKGLRHAVVNLDDDYAAQVLAIIPTEVKVLTYSAAGNTAADVVFEAVHFNAVGVSARLRTPWGSRRCTSPLRGGFNLSNLAAAITVLLLAGEDLDALLTVVPDLQAVPGRMQPVVVEGGLQVLVDYAHTPAALEQALRALRPHVAGRLLTVFGCGGDRDRGKRSVMGRLACELSDRVIVTSDNPRSEHPLAILREIESGCTGSYQLIEDRAEAIHAALAEAVAGDCVLVAGKGHEDYQIIDDERHYFSDEQQIRQYLAGRRLT